MDLNGRWLAVLAYPVGWLLIYQAFVFVVVFAFGIWDPKFGGPWGTVEFLQLVGVAAVGAPVLSYALALALRWRWFQTAALRRVWTVAFLTVAGHLALVVGGVALLRLFDPLGPNYGLVQWPVVFVLAVAPLLLVMLLSRRPGAVPGAV